MQTCLPRLERKDLASIIQKWLIRIM